MEPPVASTVEFYDSSKKIWDSVSDSLSQPSNVSRVYELYEQTFTTKQSRKLCYMDSSKYEKYPCRHDTLWTWV